MGHGQTEISLSQPLLWLGSNWLYKQTNGGNQMIQYIMLVQCCQTFPGLGSQPWEIDCKSITISLSGWAISLNNEGHSIHTKPGCGFYPWLFPPGSNTYITTLKGLLEEQPQASASWLLSLQFVALIWHCCLLTLYLAFLSLFVKQESVQVMSILKVNFKDALDQQKVQKCRPNQASCVCGKKHCLTAELTCLQTTSKGNFAFLPTSSHGCVWSVWSLWPRYLHMLI